MPPLIRKIEPGDIIGRCRIIRELGRGGVGTVYLADHRTLRIEVAIKILSPSLSLDNPALGERFIREAQFAARIRHPHVISVMDAALDESSGAYYIVMEYVSGGSLAWHLRNGPLPESRALAITAAVAQALIVAEDSKIVHRDIKPENILLDPRGTPKLADLGLAKNIIDTQASITIGGSFMGTPAYMSPDQARDAKIADTRDDIYSLGATFYESLTGVPPFQGDTPYNIMSELLTKPSPRPRDLRPELHQATDLICRKMMAKNRELRYASARDLVHDLQLVQMYGDREKDQLIAVDFERESDLVRQQELLRESRYGIETSSDGAYAEPFEAPARTTGPGATPFAPSRRDRDVFGAAALLILLVVATTLFFAWAGPNHAFTFFERKLAQWSGGVPTAPPTPPTTKPKTPKPKVHEHVATAKPKTHEGESETHTAASPVPVAPSPAPHVAAVPKVPETPAPSGLTNSPAPAQPFVSVPTVAVALPVNPGTAPSAVPAEPVNTGEFAPVAPTPRFSAFAARDIAEHSLDPALLTPTGHAELLRIIGDRDPQSLTPTSWKFYFFDKNASGHAHIVTVTGGRVVKTGEDLVDSLTPYDDDLVMAEDQVLKDSADALQIAEGQLPEATVTGSEFLLLQQKNSVPMWRVTLWGRTGESEERKLGEITMLAETGTVIRNVKP